MLREIAPMLVTILVIQHGDGQQVALDTPLGQYVIHSVEVTWDIAKSRCEEAGMHLADIIGATTRSIILDALAAEGDSKFYWIGASDLQETGVYRWLDGSDVLDNDADWFPGFPLSDGQIANKQPNNVNQHCVELRNEYPRLESDVRIVDRYYWNDVFCTGFKRYICHRSSVATTEANPTTVHTTETAAPSTAETTAAQTSEPEVTTAQTAELMTTKTQTTAAEEATAQTADAEATITTYSPTAAKTTTFGSWLYWTSCSSGCSGGVTFRIQLCHGHYSTTECTEQLRNNISYSVQAKVCNTQRCPIDGVWLSWQQWHPCDVTCGKGLTFRHRSCVLPLFGGKNCVGSSAQRAMCQRNVTCEDSWQRIRRLKAALATPAFTESDKRPEAKGTAGVAVVLLMVLVIIIVQGDMPAIIRDIRGRGHPRPYRRFVRRRRMHRRPRR